MSLLLGDVPFGAKLLFHFTPDPFRTCQLGQLGMLLIRILGSGSGSRRLSGVRSGQKAWPDSSKLSNRWLQYSESNPLDQMCLLKKHTSETNNGGLTKMTKIVSIPALLCLFPHFLLQTYNESIGSILLQQHLKRIDHPTRE
jgi:hypothetical protein